MADYHAAQPKEFEEKVVEIKRVSQKTKGGNKISFTALVIVGDRKGKAGIGFSKAPDVISAIRKSIRKARKNMVSVDLVGNGTIAHEVIYTFKSATVLLKPAPEGTGVIAGGPVRAVVDAIGIRNLVSKRLGSANKTLNVYATIEALKSLLPASSAKGRNVETTEPKIVTTPKTPIKADARSGKAAKTRAAAPGRKPQRETKKPVTKKATPVK